MSRHIIVVALCVVLAGCMMSRMRPIQNIDHQAIATGSGQTLTLGQVRNAIIQAATEKTWTTKDVDSDTLEATVQVRSHAATVRIDYSPTAYSINFHSVDNLLQEGEWIHRRYNDWVQGLRITIDRQLAEL